MVLAPDGQVLVRELMPRIENKEEVEAYIAETLKKNDMDCMSLTRPSLAVSSREYMRLTL